MKRWNPVAAVAGLSLLAALVLNIVGVGAQDGGNETPEGESVSFTWSGDVNAPEFPADMDWLNATEPVRLEDLRGKLVLLDFWTYGCINCIHVIPDLKRLEAEYPDELVVIGVHSAKFDNEGETANIRRIVQRYEVEHPVVNDNDFAIWNQYGVRAWPTFMLLDPFGKVVGQLSGEPLYPRIQPIIDTMVREYGEAGLLNLEPITYLQPDPATLEATALRFPGKVLADEAGNRLFISDSNHDRIVITSLDTFEVLEVIGSGESGWQDGDVTSAQFRRPQGLALVDDTLYIADTGNHAIRAADLAAGTVTTVAGTGQQGFVREGSAPGTDMPLSSPWDLVAHEGKLYIAMAGPHQLWVFDIASRVVGPYAGSGREALIDGPLASSALNQPSGIDTDGELLYFADAEASAIRTASLDPAGEVLTIVGTGLFDFGDADGVGDEVLLQHPLGVTVADDGYLYVADTYNNKIKRLDPATQESVTFLGTGDGALADGASAAFYEPGGLDYAAGKLYIADTNNHAIRVADVASQSVTTVEFPNVERLLPPPALEPVTSLQGDFTSGDLLDDGRLPLMPQTVAAGAGTLLITVNMPDGYKLNDLAPFTAIWPDDPLVHIPAEQREFRALLPDLPIEVPAVFEVGQTEIELDLTVYWCEAINEALCFVDRAQLVLPLTVLPQGDTNTAVFERDLVPPIVQDTLG